MQNNYKHISGVFLSGHKVVRKWSQVVLKLPSSLSSSSTHHIIIIRRNKNLLVQWVGKMLQSPHHPRCDPCRPRDEHQRHWKIWSTDQNPWSQGRGVLWIPAVDAKEGALIIFVDIHSMKSITARLEERGVTYDDQEVGPVLQERFPLFSICKRFGASIPPGPSDFHPQFPPILGDVLAMKFFDWVDWSDFPNFWDHIADDLLLFGLQLHLCVSPIQSNLLQKELKDPFPDSVADTCFVVWFLLRDKCLPSFNSWLFPICPIKLWQGHGVLTVVTRVC